MKTLISTIATLLIFLSYTSCEKDNNSIHCDNKVIISAEEYDTAPNDSLTINNLKLVGGSVLLNIVNSDDQILFEY